MHAKLLQSWLTLYNPRNIDHQAPMSMAFSRQQYWSRLAYPAPGDLPDPRTEPTSLKSPALPGWFFAINSMWEAPKVFSSTTI